MVLLVMALAFVVPASASTPTWASGDVEITDWTYDDSGNDVAIVKWSGTFEGTLTHTFSEGRADTAEFEGFVEGRYGTLTMLILPTKFDQSVPGFEGRWMILGGTEGLQTLRGQGTFVLNSFDPVAGPYGGQIHFDPE
jgi:hypothetical protein